MSAAPDDHLTEPGFGFEDHTPKGPEGLELEPPIPEVTEVDRDRLWASVEDGEIPEAATVGAVRPFRVFGDDDRRPVADSKSYPWHAICFLLIRAADGTQLLGTGWLAGPRLVVTAGHCVYKSAYGGWALSIEVYPGRNGSEIPFEKMTVERSGFRTVAGWTEREDPEFDYGALVLPRELDERLGHFGFRAASESELSFHVWNLGGYPADRDFATLWWHARKIGQVGRNTFHYTIDTEGGQSGAPVWRSTDDGPLVVGIHSGHNVVANRAVRIDRRVYENLRTWKRT